MQELELTVFDRGDEGVLVQRMLDDFEKINKIHVNMQLLDWEAGWGKLVEIALYNNGPDLSEVGSTWVMDLVRMNALNNLNPREVALIGSKKDFFPTNWESGIAANPTAGQDPFTWAIPWTSDVRLTFFRQDLLGKAHIDPENAFKHIDSLAESLQKLKASGAAMPVTLSMKRSRINLHNLASWIWDAGGDFLAKEGNRVAFDSPEALLGMRHYFQLGQFLPASHREISDLDSDRLFINGEAAVTFSGYWILINPGLSPATRENMRVVGMPGASFVGGTHLVNWKHSRKREMAMTLVDFLVKHSADHNIFPAYSLPAYIPSWEKVHFIEEPYFSAILAALQKGRSFPIGQLWGLVEKRLTDTIPAVWEKVNDADENDIEKILAENINPLARRINMTLE